MTKHYAIEVENFGPIVNASVAMRPLTVFVGPSNTGKSYLAVLIYALHRSLGISLPYHRSALRTFRPRRLLPRGELRAPLRASLAAWSRRLAPGREAPRELPRGVRDHVRRTVQQSAPLQSAVGAEVRRCFGVDALRDLVRGPNLPSKRHARIGLRISHDAATAPVRYDFQLGAADGADNASASVPGFDAHLGDVLQDLASLGHIDGQIELDYFMGAVVRGVFESTLGPVARPAYYLPADRTGVIHSHQMVVGTLLQGATTAGLRPATHVPVLSGVLVDFLDQLIAVSGLPRSRGDKIGRALASALEDNMLQGGIHADAGAIGYPTFTYQPRGWKRDVPLLRTSSMVSELTPVVLYLRHLVRPGDLLIIEEPEAHLHPAMQAALAREIARCVRADIRVVITTHSDWFLEQIGNLVRLSSLPAKEQARLGGAEVALDPQDVGAWLFRPSRRPNGSKVQEIELDPETGLFPTDHDRVGEALYNEGAAIFNRAQGVAG